MLFFRVKEEHDNKKKGNDIYIGNELYTLKEVNSQNLNINFLEKVEIPKNKVYWCFGARMAIAE